MVTHATINKILLFYIKLSVFPIHNHIKKSLKQQTFKHMSPFSILSYTWQTVVRWKPHYIYILKGLMHISSLLKRTINLFLRNLLRHDIKDIKVWARNPSLM